jgi:hypothetical protein
MLQSDKALEEWSDPWMVVVSPGRVCRQVALTY